LHEPVTRNRLILSTEQEIKSNMKLFVLGATGHTGTHIVDLALSRFHGVTAFVRSPQKIAHHDPRLRIVGGNPLEYCKCGLREVKYHLEA
jgi:nucleoside-diphosphate-sugar epimerase